MDAKPVTLELNHGLPVGSEKRFGIDMIQRRRKVIDARTTYRVVSCQMLAEERFHVEFEPTAKRKHKPNEERA